MHSGNNCFYRLGSIQSVADKGPFLRVQCIEILTLVKWNLIYQETKCSHLCYNLNTGCSHIDSVGYISYFRLNSVFLWSQFPKTSCFSPLSLWYIWLLLDSFSVLGQFKTYKQKHMGRGKCSAVCMVGIDKNSKPWQLHGLSKHAWNKDSICSFLVYILLSVIISVIFLLSLDTPSNFFELLFSSIDVGKQEW